MTSVTSINNYSEFTVKQRKNVAGSIPHRAAPYEEFFSWSSRHHCPMEVGAYARVSRDDNGSHFLTRDPRDPSVN